MFSPMVRYGVILPASLTVVSPWRFSESAEVKRGRAFCSPEIAFVIFTVQLPVIFRQNSLPARTAERLNSKGQPRYSHA